MATGQGSPSKPLDVSEDDWAEAVRREETIRALAADDTNDKATVRIAADRLGLSPAQIYRLITKFRETPVTASLVVMKPGPKKSARLLPGPIECRIDDAIEKIFKTRERPTVAKLQRDLWKDCRAAGVYCMDQPQRFQILGPYQNAFEVWISVSSDRCNNKLPYTCDLLSIVFPRPDA